MKPSYRVISTACLCLVLGIGACACGPQPPPPEPAPEDSGLRRILVLQDLDDPIITEDGSEITLTAGDVESCPAAIADNLIAAGLAEPAPL